MTRETVYGRRPVREVIRAGRRQILELFATERALASEPWLRDATGLRVHVEREGKLNELAGSRDHQGVVAFCEPYKYADAYELSAGERPLIACLDQVTDPHNLGAVCRTAEVAGATGLVIPERRSVHVTPAVCKASAGAVEHLPVARVRNLADFLAAAKEAGCWCYGAAADATTAYDQPDYRGGVVLVLGAEGKGLRPRVAAACDALVALPIRGRVASLNVSAAAAALLYGILQRRAELDIAP